MKQRTKGHTETTISGDTRADWSEAFELVPSLQIARLALAFGIDHILIDRNRPTDPQHSMYCSTTAITRGKPALTIESGLLGRSDAESVEAIVEGVRGVLRELGMMQDGPAALTRPVYLDPAEVVASPETGILDWMYY